jgi:hypothetical protein
MHRMCFVMKFAWIFLFISTAVAAPLPDTSLPQVPHEMTGNEKFRFYLKATCGPEAILSGIAGSAIGQARDSAPEWGQGTAGYGKRLGSLFGQKVIKNSFELGIGSFLHEDPRYFASDRSGIWRRTVYAAGRVFAVRKYSGATMPAYSRFIGIAGSVLISSQWHPQSVRTPARYSSDCAISLIMDVAKNIFKEFRPDIKKLFRK